TERHVHPEADAGVERTRPDLARRARARAEGTEEDVERTAVAHTLVGALDPHDEVLRTVAVEIPQVERGTKGIPGPIAHEMDVGFIEVQVGAGHGAEEDEDASRPERAILRERSGCAQHEVQLPVAV